MLNLLRRLKQKLTCKLFGCYVKLDKTVYSSGCLWSDYVCQVCGKRHHRSKSSSPRVWSNKMVKRTCDNCVGCNSIPESQMSIYCKGFKRA